MQQAKRVALIGYSILPYQIVQGFKNALPNASFERADRLIVALRSVKSPTEIEMLSQAFRISEIALAEILRVIRPGMSELAVVGVAQKAMYENGAEYEGMPQYVLYGPTPCDLTTTHRLIEKTIWSSQHQCDVMPLLSGVARPVVALQMTPKMRDLVEFWLESTHLKTFELLRPGDPPASRQKYTHSCNSVGYGEMLYGRVTV